MRKIAAVAARGSQSTISFSDGTRGCVALERLGPPWHGGFVWVLHATLCLAAATLPIEQSDINAVLGMIRINTYDPVGNLTRPKADRNR